MFYWFPGRYSLLPGSCIRNTTWMSAVLSCRTCCNSPCTVYLAQAIKSAFWSPQSHCNTTSWYSWGMSYWFPGRYSMLSCARFTIQMRGDGLQQLWQEGTTDIHVVFLMQLPGITGGCFTTCLMCYSGQNTTYNRNMSIYDVTSVDWWHHDVIRCRFIAKK
jgi:hypothetical protein